MSLNPETKRDYLPKIHLCLTKLEQTPPASPQATIVLKSILEFIPLRLEKHELRRDEDLRKLFLQTNFFNNLTFYLDSTHGPTVMVAIALINSLFIRHYIDIPTTIRLYLPALLKAMANTELPTEVDTIRFLHNTLAFITMLLKSCDQMDLQKKESFYALFISEFSIKSLQYIFQRFLLFFTKHWYDATLTEQELVELSSKQKEELTKNTKSPQHQGQLQSKPDFTNSATSSDLTTSHSNDSSPQTNMDEQQQQHQSDEFTSTITPSKKVKITLYTPRESMDYFYQGIEYLLFPFVGFINILILNTTPSDYIVSIFTEMLYLARDFLYKTCICTVPRLCDGTSYYFTQPQAVVQLSFFQLYFQTILITFRCATLETFELTRRKLLTNNWFFQTLLYFMTVYHQATLPDGKDSGSINYVKQTIAIYKARENDLPFDDATTLQMNEELTTTVLSETTSPPLFKEQDVDYMAVAVALEQHQASPSNVKPSLGAMKTKPNPIISSEFLLYALPNISSLIFGVTRRLFPTESGNGISIHYDLCKAMCFSGIFRYLFSQEIIFPRPHQNDMLNLSPQYHSQTDKLRRDEGSKFLKQERFGIIESAKKKFDGIETEEEKGKDIETDGEQQDHKKSSNEPTHTKVVQHMLPGAHYTDLGALSSIFPVAMTLPSQPNQPNQKNVKTPPENGESTPLDNKNQDHELIIESGEDYLATLWMAASLLRTVDFYSEPTHKPPHPSGYVKRDSTTREPIRDHTEFARYFINNCQLYQFLIRWVGVGYKLIDSNGRLLDDIDFKAIALLQKSSKNGSNLALSGDTTKKNVQSKKLLEVKQVLADLTWEIIEDTLLPSIDYSVTNKVLIAKVVESFKEQQYRQINQRKEHPSQMGRFIHEFWAWKNKRIQNAIDQKNKNAEREAKDEELFQAAGSNNKIQEVKLAPQHSPTSPPSLSSEQGSMTHGMEETDIDQLIKEDEMRKQIRIEHNVLDKLPSKNGQDSVLVNENLSPQTNAIEEDDVSMPDLEQVSVSSSLAPVDNQECHATTINNNLDRNNGDVDEEGKPKKGKRELELIAKKALFEATRSKIRDKSLKNSLEFADLYQYDFPHNFLELSPYQLVQFTKKILSFKAIYSQKEQLHLELLKDLQIQRECAYDISMRQYTKDLIQYREDHSNEHESPDQVDASTTIEPTGSPPTPPAYPKLPTFTDDELKVPLSPEETILYQSSRQLDEDLTVFLMSKAPISFQYYGFPFYFFEKPTMVNKFDLPDEILQHRYLFTPDFFTLIQLLTATTPYSFFDNNFDTFIMDNEGMNYFTYMIALYQQSRQGLSNEPSFVHRAIHQHAHALVRGVVTTQFQSSTEVAFDLYQAVGVGCVRFDSHRLEPMVRSKLNVAASSLSEVIEQVKNASLGEQLSTTSPEQQQFTHHEIILNEYGESEYVRGLDRNLLPINLDPHESTVNQALFTLLTEMKLVCKKAQIFQDTEIIVDNETALTIPSDTYTKMITRVHSARQNTENKFLQVEKRLSQFDEKYGDPTNKSQPTVKEVDSIERNQNDSDNNNNSTTAPATSTDIPPNNFQGEEGDDDLPPPLEEDEDYLDDDEIDYLGDDPIGQMIDPNDPNKIINKATKHRTAQTYKFKPSIGTMKVQNGVVFDTQDQNKNNPSKLMAFNFSLLRPDALEKHEYQTFKFSDRETADPGVSEYITHTRDFERDRDFVVKQMKYLKNSFFFEGVGFQRRAEEDSQKRQNNAFVQQTAAMREKLNGAREVKQKMIRDVMTMADRLAEKIAKENKDDSGETTSASAVATELDESGVHVKEQYSDEEELDMLVVDTETLRRNAQKNAPSTTGLNKSYLDQYQEDFVDEETELEFYMRGLTPPSESATIQRNQARVQQLEHDRRKATVNMLQSKLLKEEQQVQKIISIGRRLQSGDARRAVSHTVNNNSNKPTHRDFLSSHKPGEKDVDPKVLTPGELAQRREILMKRLKELEDLRSRIIEQVELIEDDLFPPDRPLPEKNDKNSKLYQEFISDMSKFDKFKLQQIQKLKQIDNVSREMLEDFKFEHGLTIGKYGGDANKEKGEEITLVTPKVATPSTHSSANDAIKIAQEFDFMANVTTPEGGGEDHKVASETKKPPTVPLTTRKPHQLVDDSDYEDHLKDQAAMKKHYQEQKRQRNVAAKNAKQRDDNVTNKQVAQEKDTPSPVKPQSETAQKQPHPLIITHSFSLPPSSDKTQDGSTNDYILTHLNVPKISTLPIKSILRHNPAKPFVPRELPSVTPAESKIIPICHTKPLKDDEIWANPDNVFEWLNEDPRKGTTSYGDKTIKMELELRIDSNGTIARQDGDKREDGDDDDDDTGMTDVMDMLNKKKKSITTKVNKETEQRVPTDQVSLTTTTSSSLTPYQVDLLSQDALKIDALRKQDYDVSREQLESLYFFAKTWTYEELYLHFLRFDQATIYDMKRSLEFMLRLNLPDDFKDIELKKNMTSIKPGRDILEYESIDDMNQKKKKTLIQKADEGSTRENTFAQATEHIGAIGEDDGDNDDLEDPHKGMSVMEDVSQAKKEKLGDEDKFFAKIAVRRQKLIARYQLPALYRYIHERVNNIAPPAPILAMFNPEQGKRFLGSPKQQRGPTTPFTPQERQQLLLQQDQIQHQRQPQQQQNQGISLTGQRQPTEQELYGMRMSQTEQMRRRK